MAAPVGKEITGVMQTVAGAFTHPMITFRTQPGRWKGKRKDPNRKFIPNPKYPDGITWSFPTWFVALIGVTVVIEAIGGLTKVLDGVLPTLKEKLGIEKLKEQTEKTKDVMPGGMGFLSEFF